MILVQQAVTIETNQSINTQEARIEDGFGEFGAEH